MEKQNKKRHWFKTLTWDVAFKPKEDITNYEMSVCLGFWVELVRESWMPYQDWDTPQPNNRSTCRDAWKKYFDTFTDNVKRHFVWETRYE